MPMGRVLKEIIRPYRLEIDIYLLPYDFYNIVRPKITFLLKDTTDIYCQRCFQKKSLS